MGEYNQVQYRLIKDNSTLDCTLEQKSVPKGETNDTIQLNKWKVLGSQDELNVVGTDNIQSKNESHIIQLPLSDNESVSSNSSVSSCDSSRTETDSTDDGYTTTSSSDNIDSGPYQSNVESANHIYPTNAALQSNNGDNYYKSEKQRFPKASVASESSVVRKLKQAVTYDTVLESPATSARIPESVDEIFEYKSLINGFHMIQQYWKSNSVAISVTCHLLECFWRLYVPRKIEAIDVNITPKSALSNLLKHRSTARSITKVAYNTNKATTRNHPIFPLKTDTRRVPPKSKLPIGRAKPKLFLFFQVLGYLNYKEVIQLEKLCLGVRFVLVDHSYKFLCSTIWRNLWNSMYPELSDRVLNKHRFKQQYLRSKSCFIASTSICDRVIPSFCATYGVSVFEIPSMIQIVRSSFGGLPWLDHTKNEINVGDCISYAIWVMCILKNTNVTILRTKPNTREQSRLLNLPAKCNLDLLNRLFTLDERKAHKLNIICVESDNPIEHYTNIDKV